MEEIQFADS